MSIPKTAKVEAEIEKVKDKISEFQTRLRELEQKKTELENTEIVGVVRGMNISIEELAVMLQTIRGGVVPTSGHRGQKSEPAPAPDIEEETEE